MHISVFETFATVAKCGSISIASDEVHLTQPAVTKQIQYLEEIYGVKLFERGSKLRLTEEGRILLVYAHQILNTYAESVISLNETRDKLRGKLKFGSNLTLGIYILPKLINQFSTVYPDIKLDIFLDNTEHIVKAIRHKELSFGFIGMDVKEPQIKRHVFYEDKITIVVGKQLGLAKQVGWNQLQELPFITRERGSDIRESLEDWLKARAITLRPALELNNTEAIKECVRCGTGFSCLPRCTVQQDIKLGLLDEVYAPYFEPVQEFYICHYEGRKFSAVEKVFLEFLFQAIESRAISPLSVAILPPDKLPASPSQKLPLAAKKEVPENAMAACNGR